MEKPHVKKLKRHEAPGHARLLNFACYQNQPFLKSARTCEWLCSSIERARDTHEFRLWAFVIMPDHVHLLLWPRSPVPDLLRSIKQSVSRRAVQWARQERPETLERMRDPRGVHRFWQRGGGFDRNLWEPEPIWNAIDYIHMNPVNAGLCEHPDDWPWSSAAYFMGRGESPVPLDTDTIPPRPSQL